MYGDLFKGGGDRDILHAGQYQTCIAAGSGDALAPTHEAVAFRCHSVQKNGIHSGDGQSTALQRLSVQGSRYAAALGSDDGNVTLRCFEYHTDGVIFRQVLQSQGA